MSLSFIVFWKSTVSNLIYNRNKIQYQLTNNFTDQHFLGISKRNNKTGSKKSK